MNYNNCGHNCGQAQGELTALITSSRKRKCEMTDSRVLFHFHQHGNEYHSQQCYALQPQASVKHCVYFLKEM